MAHATSFREWSQEFVQSGMEISCASLLLFELSLKQPAKQHALHPAADWLALA
jgi:hypothetical protein